LFLTFAFFILHSSFLPLHFFSGVDFFWLFLPFPQRTFVLHSFFTTNDEFLVARLCPFKQITASAYVDVLKALPRIAERLAVAGGSRG
jgi:hypothetical protein